MKTTPIAIALCLTLVGGCTTRRGAKTTMVAGLGIALAGAALGVAAYERASDRPEPEYAGVAYGGPVVVVGTALVVGSLLNLIVLDVTKRPEPAAGPVARPEVAPAPDVPVVRCTALEIDASRGDAPSIEAGLEPLRSRLAQAPYSAWNQYRVVTKAQTNLTEGRPAALGFELGAASVTATTLDPSRIRVETTIDDAIGQRHIYPASDVTRGAYALVGPISVGARAHLLALACT